MRRLVVGCGYLGLRVAAAWREAGDEVFATTRGARVDLLAQAGLQPLRLDVTQAHGSSHLPAVDTVVFAVGRDQRGGATMHDIHVSGLRGVLDALPEPPERVVYVSTTGVYAQDAGEWVDEASPCDPVREGALACLRAERLLWAHRRGRDAVVLRLAGLYGPGRLPRGGEVRAGRTIAGSAESHLNLLHVEDAAQAVLAAASRPVAGRTYVVSDGQPPTRGEYVAVVAKLLGVAPPPFGGGGGLGKRVRNERAIRELGLGPRYPSYRDGLASLP